MSTDEKTYGGFTLSEIRLHIENHTLVHVVHAIPDLVAEIEWVKEHTMLLDPIDFDQFLNVCAPPQEGPKGPTSLDWAQRHDPQSFDTLLKAAGVEHVVQHERGVSIGFQPAATGDAVLVTEHDHPMTDDGAIVPKVSE